MITSNVIHRTFWLKRANSNSIFTGFTIDVDDRQYLCTAKHCVPDADSESFSHIEIFRYKRWNQLEVKLIGFGSKGSDICVLGTNEILSPQLPMLPTSVGIAFGQDAYFLGFPHGLRTDVKIKVNRGYPVPFIKKCIMSAERPPESKPELGVMYFDGHNNKGFSGGPIIFRENGNPRNDFKVAAVVSSFMAEPGVFIDGLEKDMMSIELEDGKRRNMMVNAGIFVAHDIRHAIDAIKKNPIGIEIETRL